MNRVSLSIPRRILTAPTLRAIDPVVPPGVAGLLGEVVGSVHTKVNHARLIALNALALARSACSGPVPRIWSGESHRSHRGIWSRACAHPYTA